MAYNNPYANYPYQGANNYYANNNAYQTPYQQPIYSGGQPYIMPQQPIQQPVQQAQPQTQPNNILPLAFVNGIEGAKTYVVLPNQTFYLRDSDSNLIFEKKADAQGKCTIIPYELKRVEDVNSINKTAPTQSAIDTSLFLKKEDLRGYATLDDFSKLDIKLDNALDKISRQIDKLNNRNYNYNTGTTPMNKEPKKDSE